MRGSIDIHCHILPGLDDGADTLEHAIRMAMMAVDSGVSHVVCTPHCSASDRNLSSRIERIRRSVGALGGELDRLGIPLTLHTGMELLCDGGLARALERGEVLTLAGSRCLLIEFRFDVRVAAIERAAAEVKRAGYVPVLAHPERYPVVWETPECMEIWASEGYLLQLDKDSVLGRFGRRCASVSRWALSRGLVFTIASDAHDTRKRTPEMRTVWSIVEREFGPSLRRQLMDNGISVLRDFG